MSTESINMTMAGSRKRRAKDRLASIGVTTGGILVLVALLLIFFYLLYVVKPIFSGASLEPAVSLQVPVKGTTAILGTDDQNQVGYRLSAEGHVDFFALDNGSYGTAIISNSKIKLLMKCEPKEAAAIAESMELTKAEVDKIQTMKRGTCLLVANQNHIFIDVKATPMEHDLITTDREDLQRIARKNAEARVFQ